MSWTDRPDAAASQLICKDFIGRFHMPRGRSTFAKRQKEQARQQKQRDKNERKTMRKQDGGAVDPLDELQEMRELAAAQAALFQVGSDEELNSLSPLLERGKDGDQ
jgi:hypothetical protein